MGDLPNRWINARNEARGGADPTWHEHRAQHSSAWPVKSPCQKLSRATVSPARMRRSSILADSDAGPMVATILVCG